MIETIVLGGVLRVCEAFLAATPTLLCGFLTVAVFRVFVGPQGIRNIYEGPWGSGLLKSWGMGMLLPVCSLGTIPILRELRRNGVSTGNLLAFGLTEPLFNPLSLIYGLTLAEPWAVICFALASLVVVTVIGILWDVTFGHQQPPLPDDPRPPAGAKRLTLAFLTTCDEMLDWRNWIWIALGLSGMVLMSAVFSHGSLQGEAQPNDAWAPARMAFLATWIYSTPLTVMGQLSSMFQHGNSVGAAFVLFVLGAGLNPGTLGWLVATHGVRKAVVWFVMLLALTLGLAYAIDKPLTPTDVEPANHTHAFDGYSNPFLAGGHNLSFYFFDKLQDAWTPDVRVCTYVLFGIAGAGLLVSVFDSGGRMRAWTLLPDDPAATHARFDVQLPGWSVGLATVGGLVAFSVFGCYVYYPDAETTFAQIVRTKTEVISTARSEDWELTEKYIPIMENEIRSLQIGVYLRELSLSDYRRVKSRVLLHKLELLEHAVEDGHRDEIERHSREVETAFRRMRDAFSDASA